MIANFYNISCPKDTVNKTTYLSAATDVTISPYEAIDDLAGYIIVSPSKDEYNYVKIKNLNGRDRYYFVTAREDMTAQRCRLSLEEDVLMTFLNEIMDSEFLPKRGYNSSIVNADMPDRRPTYQYSITTQYAKDSSNGDDFNYGTDSLNFDTIVLVVVGKGVI